MFPITVKLPDFSRQKFIRGFFKITVFVFEEIADWEKLSIVRDQSFSDFRVLENKFLDDFQRFTHNFRILRVQSP
jgi:hypothetical protein